MNISLFVPPIGINFHLQQPIPLDLLSDALCKIVVFMQANDKYKTLKLYSDWWQHDGLHFDGDHINILELLEIVKAPQAILGFMPGDDYVRVGIAPESLEWYLRFYAVEANNHLRQGDFDITLPKQLSEKFRQEVMKNLGLSIQEEPSTSYYSRIMM